MIPNHTALVTIPMARFFMDFTVSATLIWSMFRIRYISFSRTAIIPLRSDPVLKFYLLYKGWCLTRKLQIETHLWFEQELEPQWRIQDLTLGGGVDLVNGGGCRKCRKSLKVLMVEVKVSFSVFFGHISITIMLKISRERRKNWEKIAFWA